MVKPPSHKRSSPCSIQGAGTKICKRSRTLAAKREYKSAICIMQVYADLSKGLSSLKLGRWLKSTLLRHFKITKFKRINRIINKKYK